jgi:CubicO group peptidase (beta-lactamase class C family)
MKFPHCTSPAGARQRQWLFISCLTFGLAACGGGGGGGGGGSGGGGGNGGPPPGPTNLAPTVNAGTDQNIELPTSSVQLQPVVTDDGSPTPASLTYTWTAPGASGVTFDSATSASTTARFTMAGTHTLQLAVSDGSLSTTDTVQVVVNPAVFPQATWTTATPAEMRMNEALLAQARDHALTGGGDGFIARRGRSVMTWGNPTTTSDVKSASKSIGSIALGLALADGRLQLADSAKQRFPGMGGAVNATDPRIATVTVLQLATHAAGFPKDGGEQPLANTPGTIWTYSDSGPNWLADTLTHVYAQDLHSLLSTRVFATLGIGPNDLQWRDNGFRSNTLDVNGTAVNRRELASGISIDVEALARIGHLFLRRGMWGDQRVLPESFIDLVRQPRPENAGLPVLPTPSDYPQATSGYGILWWTNTTGALPGVPRDAFWAWGLYDSLLIVIPSLELVIARTGVTNSVPTSGRTWNDSEWNADYTVLAPFLDPIVQSVAP